MKNLNASSIGGFTRTFYEVGVFLVGSTITFPKRLGS